MKPAAAIRPRSVLALVPTRKESSISSLAYQTGFSKHDGWHPGKKIYSQSGFQKDMFIVSNEKIWLMGKDGYMNISVC